MIYQLSVQKQLIFFQVFQLQEISTKSFSYYYYPICYYSFQNIVIIIMRKRNGIVLHHSFIIASDYLRQFLKFHLSYWSYQGCNQQASFSNWKNCLITEEHQTKETFIAKQQEVKSLLHYVKISTFRHNCTNLIQKIFYTSQFCSSRVNEFYISIREVREQKHITLKTYKFQFLSKIYSTQF